MKQWTGDSGMSSADERVLSVDTCCLSGRSTVHHSILHSTPCNSPTTRQPAKMSASQQEEDEEEEDDEEEEEERVVIHEEERSLRQLLSTSKISHRKATNSSSTTPNTTIKAIISQFILPITMIIMCHQPVQHVHSLQVPSFLQRGQAVPCARGQPVDLTALFPSSELKLNCIQNHDGAWFSCQCPEGFINCEERPSCALHAPKPVAESTGPRMDPSPSSSPTSALFNLKSLPSVKAKPPKTPKARRGEHKPKHIPAASTRQATLELNHDERGPHKRPEESAGDQFEGVRLLARILNVPVSDVLATKSQSAKRMRERTSTTQLAPTTTPSPTTTLLTTTRPPPTTTPEPTTTTTTTTTTPEPETTTDESDTEEPGSTAEPDMTAATEEDYDRNRLQTGPVDVESLINPNNEPPPILMGPVWPPVAPVPGEAAEPTSGGTEVEQATNEAMFYVALGVELFVLSVIVALAVYFWYKDAKMSRKDANRKTSRSRLSLSNNNINNNHNHNHNHNLCKPSSPVDSSSSAISLVSNDNDKQQLHQLSV